VQAFIALSKLTLFECDNWDLSHVRQNLDLLEVLQQLAGRFEEAGKEFDVDPLTLQHSDVFSRVVKKIQRIKGWFDGRQVGCRTQDIMQAGNEGAMGPDEEAMVGVQFDLLDEAFWLEVMSDWETLQ
jgi:hypothetical protein